MTFRKAQVGARQLSFRIGLGTLAYAFNRSDYNNPFDEPTNDFKQQFMVTNPELFAKEVCRAMNDEAEDGSTPLTRFLDSMMQAALENGCEGVEEL